MAAAAAVAAGEGVVVYRQVLRSIRRVFGNDPSMKEAAQREARTLFASRRGETDPERVRANLDEGREAAAFIEQNIVQAPLNDRGNYEVQLRPEVMQDGIVLEEVAPKSRGKDMGKR
eukprot:jgi/Chlat1/8497/Chrsp80S07892